MATGDEFWRQQDALPFWTVPIAHGGEMPWLQEHERGLLVAIHRAHQLGKTPLLIDTSEDGVVDIYYTYAGALVVEAKRMVVEVATGRATVEQTLEACRVQCVNAMRYGQTLYVRLLDSACDFCGTFHSATQFPLALFDRRTVGTLIEYREGSAQNLWGSSHPLGALLREEDLSEGVFQPRFSHTPGADGTLAGFECVVCTRLAPDECAALLAEALPMSNLQPIRLLPSSVRLSYCAYTRTFELAPGGSLSWGALDEEFCLSFAFKGDFTLRLRSNEPVAARHAGRRTGRRSGGHSATSTSGLDRQPSRVSRRASDCLGGETAGKDGAKADGQAASGEQNLLEARRGGAFHNMRGGGSYVVEVIEDEEAEAAARAASGIGATPGAERLSAAILADARALGEKSASHASASRSVSSAAPLAGRSDDGRTAAAAHLARELRDLSTASAFDADEHQRQRRALREAADLQDVVFGAG